MREKIKSKQKMKNSLSEANYENLFKKNTRMKKELTMNDLNNNFERDFYSNRNNISEIIINKSNSMVKLINNNYKKFDIFPNIKKELINISYLWNSSGISSKYKVNFINNYQLMTKEEKIKLIKEEKQKIEILIKKLKQFNGDYCLRKKIIKKIKEEINLIKKEKTEDNIGDIIDKIIKYLGELRLYSVNTVLNFYEVKNLINILFKNNSTIIDLKMLYKLYLYDKDYLLKINDDISFIKECTVLPNYIEMNNFRGMDTFLVNCSYKLIDNTDKINDKKIIPIDDKTKAEIKKCKYIIKNEKFSLPQNSFSFFISNYLKTPKPQKKLILKLNNSQICHKKLITVNGYKKNFTKTNKSSKNEKKENSYPPEIKKELKKYKLLVDKAKNLEKENENLKKIMERYEKEKNEEKEKEKVIKEKEKSDKELEKERLKKIEIEKQDQEIIQYLGRKKSDKIIESKKSKNKDFNKKEKIFEKTGFKVEYYLDKLDNLISKIKKDIPINEISDDIKSLFNKKLEEKIYDKMTYFSGMYPKVITCVNKESDSISGICSFYYESIGENNLIIVRINTLFAIGDWKSQFIQMVNFLKSNAQYDRIKIILCITKDNKGEDGDGSSIGIKKFFEEKLLFSVDNVIEENDVKKMEMVFIKDEVKTIFCFNLKSVLSSYYKKKADEAEILDDDIKDIMKEFEKDSKYINLFPVFFILNHLDKGKRFNYYKLNFSQKGYQLNFNNINIDFMKVIKDKNLDDDKIKNFCQYYETCLYRKLYPLYKQNNLILPCDALEINLNKNLLFCHSLLFNGYYYNKIAKDILKGYDKDTKCNYYIVPLKDQNNKLFFYEMNENSIQKYLDDKKNIYKLFVDLLTEDDKKDKNEPLEKNENGNNDNEISLYIPSFKITDNFHYSNINHIIKKITSIKDINEEEIKLISFDGLVSIEFNGDNFISNNFNYSIPEDEENIVIKNNFIFGLINFSILKHKEYIYNSFLHLVYVTKERWKRC